jgi:hypothetical protein
MGFGAISVLVPSDGVFGCLLCLVVYCVFDLAALHGCCHTLAEMFLV